MVQHTDEDAIYDEPEQADTRPQSELEADLEALREQVMRAQADYQNLKRRVQSDYEAGLKRTLRPLVDELLLVLDFLELALASPAGTPDARNLATGVELTRAKLLQALEGIDVRPLVVGERFDPALHEATETRNVESSEPGTILAVKRKGYTWKEQVIRPAQVVVAAGSDEGSGETAAD